MHFVKDVKYIDGYKLFVTFENNTKKIVDLEGHLEKGLFRALKDISYFKTVRVDQDLDTIVWDNGADISPNFLYEIGKKGNGAGLDLA
jgi:hypothetical protein